LSQPISLQIEDGIAVITIDSPPVNAISAAIRRGLLQITRELAAGGSARAVRASSQTARALIVAASAGATKRVAFIGSAGVGPAAAF